MASMNLPKYFSSAYAICTIRKKQMYMREYAQNLFSPIFSPGTSFGHSSCKTTSSSWYVTTLFTTFLRFWKVGRR